MLAAPGNDPAIPTTAIVFFGFICDNLLEYLKNMVDL
jgi:hypothetical protein